MNQAEFIVNALLEGTTTVPTRVKPIQPLAPPKEAPKRSPLFPKRRTDIKTKPKATTEAFDDSAPAAPPPTRRGAPPRRDTRTEPDPAWWREQREREQRERRQRQLRRIVRPGAGAAPAPTPTITPTRPKVNPGTRPNTPPSRHPLIPTRKPGVKVRPKARDEQYAFGESAAVRSHPGIANSNPKGKPMPTPLKRNKSSFRPKR